MAQAFVLSTLALLLLLPAAVTDTQSRTVPLPDGRVLSVEVTIGNVRITGTPAAAAVIDIVRKAPTADGLSKIPIELIEDERRVRLRTVQVEGGTDPALETHLTLRVPHAAVVNDVRIMEGTLTLDGLTGAITGDLRRGSIDATNLEGVVRLETGIGHIRATQVRLSPSGLLRLRAFNGDVRLALAARPADARILALALNGTITSDIPLTMKDRWGPRWGETTLGNGEPVISLDVVTGRIELTAPPA